MTKKELIAYVALKTGYSESHVSKVLGGSRTNSEISACAEEIENGKKTSSKEVAKVPAKTKEVVPVATKDQLAAFDKDSIVKRLAVNEIGSILKQVRENRGMSQEALGDEMGVSRETISRIENNSENCSLTNFFAYFAACRVVIDFRLTYA